MKRIILALAVCFAAGLTYLAPPAGGQVRLDVRRSDGRTAGRVTAAGIASRLDTLLARIADRQALVQADSQWRRGRLRNDATLLDSLLVDEWTTTVWKAPGTVSASATETKGRYLADVKSGTRSYESIVEDGTDMRINGNAAVVTGRVTSKGYLNDEWSRGTSRFIRTYAKQLGRWRMISSHSTLVVP